MIGRVAINIRRALGLAVFGGLGLVLAFLLWAGLRGAPQDLPWTPLDLGEPVGVFTGRKLSALTQNFLKCQALMSRAGVRWQTLPARRDGPRCGYGDAVRLRAAGPVTIGFVPRELGVSCPVAAGLVMWEWNHVQPAARRHFGETVIAVEHFGSYSCRRIYGRDAGSWSEHATADAVDIAGFRLASGRRIRVVRDWNGSDQAARLFLREVRDGACDLFATTLSPDYNAAHRDHLHLDQAERGTSGWRACR